MYFVLSWRGARGPPVGGGASATTAATAATVLATALLLQPRQNAARWARGRAIVSSAWSSSPRTIMTHSTRSSLPPCHAATLSCKEKKQIRAHSRWHLRGHDRIAMMASDNLLSVPVTPDTPQSQRVHYPHDEYLFCSSPQRLLVQQRRRHIM